MTVFAQFLTEGCFLVSEVHPFLDGNGRVARVAMNNQLAAADAARIIVPTVIRDPYISALRRATAGNGPEGLYRVLRHTQEWVAAADFSSLEAGIRYLNASDAELNPADYEDRRVYLRIPSPYEL